MLRFVLLLVVMYLTISYGYHASKQLEGNRECRGWREKCSVYEDCCRDLQCSSYILRCTPIYGIKVPGQDQRPVGKSPFNIDNV